MGAAGRGRCGDTFSWRCCACSPGTDGQIWQGVTPSPPAPSGAAGLDEEALGDAALY